MRLSLWASVLLEGVLVHQMAPRFISRISKLRDDSYLYYRKCEKWLAKWPTNSAFHGSGR